MITGCKAKEWTPAVPGETESVSPHDAGRIEACVEKAAAETPWSLYGAIAGLISPSRR